MNEYFCPSCGATLNDQYGFDPSCGTWTCASCGKLLMDDDVYDGDTFEGVAWYCDNCGTLLNRQSGFSDCYGSWQCTNCSHINGITEDDIVDDSPKCPNCGSSLKDQYSFSDWYNDYTCSECGAKLHRSYFNDLFEVSEEDKRNQCPNCGAALNEQYGFADYKNDWNCSICGTRLQRDNSFSPYEVVEDDAEDAAEDCSNYSVYDSSSDDSSNNEFIEYNSNASESNSNKIEHQNIELKKQRLKAFLFKGKKIQIGFNPTDLLGKNVNDVVYLLHNQAFNNIKTIPIKDLYKGSTYTLGEVEQVFIAGSSHFSKEALIPYDIEIVIKYHAKKEISLPFAEKKLKKMNYVVVVNELRNLGFTEIYEQPIHDLVTGWLQKDGSVEKVSIGGMHSFRKNSVFTYDAEIIIEYHTFKKK